MYFLVSFFCLKINVTEHVWFLDLEHILDLSNAEQSETFLTQCGSSEACIANGLDYKMYTPDILGLNRVSYNF